MIVTRNQIEKEKSIADEVLSRLEILDPTCILAGGAPRDWWLCSTANDLDFYIYSRANTPVLEKSLQYLGLPVTPLRQSAHNVRNNDRLDNLYNTMPNLRAVYETTFRGKKVQIMVMNTPTFSGVVDKFAVSISKVWYKGGTIRVEPAAAKSFRDKQILVENGYGRNCRYVEKMIKRFPDYEFLYPMPTKSHFRFDDL